VQLGINFYLAGKMNLSTPLAKAQVMLLALAMMLLTRLPFLPQHLFSFDSVNFALALDDFNPNRNQPQPPGYPFFVAESRLVYALMGSPEATFAFVKIAAGALAVGLLYLLVARLVSIGAGVVAAMLLLVNPAFWHSSLASPIRPHLALFSVLFAYLCWLAANEHRRFFLWASLVLGLSAGFRLELPIILFPLWLWTAREVADWKFAAHSLILMLAGIGILITAVLLATGATRESLDNLIRYTFVQTNQSSPMTGSEYAGWRRMIGRNLVWYGAGALSWIWAAPWGIKVLTRTPIGWHKLGFLVVWFLPPLLFGIVIHGAAPGHTLAGQAPLTIFGAVSLCAAEEAIRNSWQPKWPMGAALSAAVVINCLIFFAEHLPARIIDTPPRSLWARILQPVRYGMYETSFSHIRWTDQMSSEAFEQIRALKEGTDQPVVVVWSREAEPVWRKVTYYFPDLPVYALEQAGDPATPTTRATLWRGSSVLAEYHQGELIPVPVPPNARIIWLLAGGGDTLLSQTVQLSSAPPVYYTDLNPAFDHFDWRAFRFLAVHQDTAGHVKAP
jgi:hypothetical protein